MCWFKFKGFSGYFNLWNMLVFLLDVWIVLFRYRLIYFLVIGFCLFLCVLVKICFWCVLLIVVIFLWWMVKVVLLCGRFFIVLVSVKIVFVVLLMMVIFVLKLWIGVWVNNGFGFIWMIFRLLCRVNLFGN